MGQRVIDMSKIRMDFARNDVNAGTLRILDREFFASLSTKKENKNEEACDENNFGEMGQKLTSGINQMLKNTTPVKADQLGFGFGGDTSSEGEEEIKEQPPLQQAENPEHEIKEDSLDHLRSQQKKKTLLKNDLKSMT